MNNGGWGLKDVLFFIVILCLSLLVAMILYHKTIGDLFGGSVVATTYDNLEKDIAYAAKDYVNNHYYKTLKNGDSDRVTLKTLQSENLIKKVVDPDDSRIECTGYATFSKENNRTTYRPYLKCGSRYKTAGYKVNYDAR